MRGYICREDEHETYHIHEAERREALATRRAAVLPSLRAVTLRREGLPEGQRNNREGMRCMKKRLAARV